MFVTDQHNFPAHASQGSEKRRVVRDAKFLTNVDWVMLGKQVIYVGHCRNHILKDMIYGWPLSAFPQTPVTIILSGVLLIINPYKLTCHQRISTLTQYRSKRPPGQTAQEKRIHPSQAWGTSSGATSCRKRPSRRSGSQFN